MAARLRIEQRLAPRTPALKTPARKPVGDNEMPYSTPQITGKVRNDLPGAGGFGTWARKCISERVTGQGASGYLTLSQTLPANSRIVWATLNNRNAITPRAASSAAASNVAIMGVALVYTAPTSLATNAATSNILCGLIQSAFGASVSANGQVAGLAVSATATGGLAPTAWQYGIGTASASIHVVPYASTVATDANGVGRYYVVSATGTSQYTLNGTGTATTGTTTADFDVQVWYEVFVAAPNA